MKKLLLVLATLGLMGQFSACTANKAQDDAEFVENADVDKIEAEEPSLDDGSSQALNGTTPSENLSTDSSLEAALGETPADTTTASNDNLSLDSAPQDPPPADIAAAPTLDESSLDAPPADVPAEVPADTLAASDLPPQDMSLDDPNALAPADDSMTAMNETPATPTESPQDPPATAMAPPAASTEAPVEPTPVLADAKPTGAGTTSLKKVSDAVPYAFGDGYVNTIYIAHPKETLKQISQTIYGSDKTKELKKINSFLKARSPRAGDKIAYVSPNRPTDSSKTITYFEDTGMIPETYVAQKGDNLRKVAKKLLGYDNAWKEVWSTNAIESKTKLAEGETFKYWKSPAAITPPTQASNEMPKTPEAAVQNIVQNNPTPPMDAVAPPPQPAMNDLPPPPAQADLPPPPADPLAAANTAPPTDPALDAAMPPPPPPDDSQFAATPPPPPEEIKPTKAPAAEGEEVAAEGGDDMMTMLGIGVLLFGALAFVLVKRKKAQAYRSNDAQAGEGLGT